MEGDPVEVVIEEAQAPEASASEATPAPQTAEEPRRAADPEPVPQEPTGIEDEPRVSESKVEEPQNSVVVEVVQDEYPSTETSEPPANAEPEVTIVVEPEESPEEKARKEQARLDAMTSYIETVEAVSLKDEAHPQLERPGVKPSARRKRTNKQKTFAELEEEERQRQEEALKPKQQVDQQFDDPLGIIQKKEAQRSVSIAQEAQNVHAAFMQKAKERKEKEEAEKKKREQMIVEEERAARASLRLSVGRSKKREAASNGEKVQIDINAPAGDGAAAGEDAPMNPVDRIKAMMKSCCVVS